MSGAMVARIARMPEMRWKVSVILFSLLAGILVVGFGWPPRYGVDLNGGVILVYQVEVDAASIGEMDEEGSSRGKTGELRSRMT
jgi:SecD/SecF fusion protein